MGLSKPIIITESAVDISNLATKSDLTAIQTLLGSGGGKIKSVQYISNTNSINVHTSSVDIFGMPGKDYTISPVDPTKTICIQTDGHPSYRRPHVTSANTVRVNAMATNSSGYWTVYTFKLWIIEFE